MDAARRRGATRKAGKGRKYSGEDDGIAFPTWDAYYTAIVRTLRESGGSADIRQIENSVARLLSVNLATLAVPYRQDSRTKFQYELAWARTKLKLAGYIDNPSRGLWSLTALGRDAPEETIASLADGAATEPLPSPPTQGPGPKFALDHGKLAFAKPDPTSGEKSRPTLLPVLRDTIDEFSRSLDIDQGLWPFLDRALQRYSASVHAAEIDYGRLFGEGVVLRRAIASAKGADGNGNQFPLTPNLTVLADSAIEIHAALMMASADGSTLAHNARAFEALDAGKRPMLPQEEFVAALAAQTAPVQEEVKDHLEHMREADVANAGLHGRSYLAAFARNAAIAITVGAAATVAIFNFPNLIINAAGGYLFNLVGGEALKKTKIVKALAERLGTLADWATVDFFSANAKTIKEIAKTEPTTEMNGLLRWLSRHSQRAGGAATKALASHPDAPLKVLIIEPDPQESNALKEHLTNWGHSVILAARSHQSASEAATNTPPDVIISETLFGDTSSAIEAADSIARQHGSRIIFVTKTPERLLHERVDSYELLSKPYLPRDLQALLKPQPVGK